MALVPKPSCRLVSSPMCATLRAVTSVCILDWSFFAHVFAGSSDDDVFYDRTVRDGSTGAAAAPGGGGGKRQKRQPAAAAIDAVTLSAQREALNAEQAQLQEAIQQESLKAAEVTRQAYGSHTTP